MAECASCKAPIVWVINAKSGTREPIDPEPRDDGNIEYVGQVDTEQGSVPQIRHLLKGEAESPTLFEPPARYVSHFSTCPSAAQHRRG